MEPQYHTCAACKHFHRYANSNLKWWGVTFDGECSRIHDAAQSRAIPCNMFKLA